MESFEAVVAKVRKALVQGPIGAEDMNAGDAFVEEPHKQYGRAHEKYEDDEELDKGVVPQHYVPAYGHVRVLYKETPVSGEDVRIEGEDPPELPEVLNPKYTDHEYVVGGYASPQVIDREKHLITKEAMGKDLPRFLRMPQFANAMILHSNVQVGTVLPKWTHPETGKTYKTAVDDIGLYVLIKLRTDKFRPKIIDKVIEDIEANKLKAFSVSGDAPVDSRQHTCTGGTCFWIIPEIEFYEITICEEGVNQDARLQILAKSCDGACGLVKGEIELKERVEALAEDVGEEEAVDMVEDVREAAEKLEKVEEEKVAGTGIGSGGSGDQNTMADFGKPYDIDTAKAFDSRAIDTARIYAKYVQAGASPEDAYFKLLDEGMGENMPVPDWFGTRDERFREFLVNVSQQGLPIPTVRLRMAGRREGEIVADPSMTAWDLLQTAVNRMRGMMDKDVAPIPHEEDDHPRQEPGEQEPEESEEYYLNLALKSLPGGKRIWDSLNNQTRALNLLGKHCSDESHLHPPDFEGSACGEVSKHRDKFGSTAHHKTGTPQGGIAQPPQTVPTEREVPEERVKTLTRLVKERNMNGAQLRLIPGYRNKPYSVSGLDELRRPVRLVGNVADLTAALSEGKREVEELGQGRIANYAVPVEVGRQNSPRIYEGDDVDPMEVIREQVAAASFESAVSKVMKHHTGVRGRDFLMDEKQQVEPENITVQGSVRPGNRAQGGHANTQIISETDIQDIAGVGQEVEQAPETHGIAQQGSVHPPRGVQGEGQDPEFVQEHEAEPEMRVENEGMPLSPEADEDTRGAPVAHRSRRP